MKLDTFINLKMKLKEKDAFQMNIRYLNKKCKHPNIQYVHILEINI